MPESPDPWFQRWADAQEPALTGHPYALARIEHAALHHELAELDGAIEVLCARRRVALGGLRRLRPRLWPGEQASHGRRRSRVDEPALPPAPEGAEPVHGVDLRELCLGILRRHGALSLRELHGLIHCHGYALGSDRAVQRLADAMAYEVRRGRCRRVERGVYEAVPAEPDARRPRSSIPGLRARPLTWVDPDADRPQLDPVVIDDPERWSEGTWPEPAPAAADRDGQCPAGRYPPSTLDEEVRLARARAAALADEVRAARSARADATAGGEPPEPARAATAPTAPPPPDPDDPRWERFVDESDPMTRTWAGRRRRWRERRAQAQTWAGEQAWEPDEPEGGSRDRSG